MRVRMNLRAESVSVVSVADALSAFVRGMGDLVRAAEALSLIASGGGDVDLPPLLPPPPLPNTDALRTVAGLLPTPVNPPSSAIISPPSVTVRFEKEPPPIKLWLSSTSSPP